MTEYGGMFLSYFFVTEYGMITLFRVMTSILFNISEKRFVLWVILILWLRILLPRTRFDKGIIISWKNVLPIIVFVICSRYVISII